MAGQKSRRTVPYQILAKDTRIPIRHLVHVQERDQAQQSRQNHNKERRHQIQDKEHHQRTGDSGKNTL